MTALGTAKFELLRMEMKTQRKPTSRWTVLAAVCTLLLSYYPYEFFLSYAS